MPGVPASLTSATLPPSRRVRSSFSRRLALVVRVQRDRARVDAVVREQGARGARVLAGDDVGRAQDLDGAGARIGEVADRRGDDVERSGCGVQTGQGGSTLRGGGPLRCHEPGRRASRRTLCGAAARRRPARAGAQLALPARRNRPRGRGRRHAGLRRGALPARPALRRRRGERDRRQAGPAGRRGAPVPDAAPRCRLQVRRAAAGFPRGQPHPVDPQCVCCA